MSFFSAASVRCFQSVSRICAATCSTVRWLAATVPRRHTTPKYSPSGMGTGTKSPSWTVAAAFTMTGSTRRPASLEAPSAPTKPRLPPRMKVALSRLWSRARALHVVTVGSFFAAASTVVASSRVRQRMRHTLIRSGES
jgi:hypothetical protein